MDSTYPDGALNAKSVGLYKARAGEVLGPPDHCFEIVGLNHTSENTPTALGQSIYIAKDLRTEKMVTLVIVSEPDTARHNKDYFERAEKMISIKPDHDKHYFLLPLDTFLILNLERQSKHPCFVYELIGPDLGYLTEYIGGDESLIPGKWILKVFKDTLEALALLHSYDVVHGDVGLRSLIITYPQLHDADPSEVSQFYGLSSDNAENEVPRMSLNGLGTGNESTSPDLAFRMKLQNFQQAFSFKYKSIVSEENQPKHYNSYLPPSTLTDVWYLASMILNFIMGYPAFTSYLNTQQQTPTDRHSLFKAIMHSRAQTRDEQQMIEETGWGDFSEAEVQSLADLLSHMLERNVEDRWTAAQALKHELLFGTV